MTTPTTKPNHVDLIDKGNQLNINYHRSFIGLANPNPIPDADPMSEPQPVTKPRNQKLTVLVSGA